jgi:copper transport protein
VTTVAALALQAVYAAGRPLGDVVRWSVVSGVFETRFGQAWSLRLLVLLVAAPLLVAAGRRTPTQRRGPLLVSLGVLATALLVTPGLAGHPGADDPAAFAVALDALHLGSVSLWLGGLAVLSLLALRPVRDPTDGTDDVIGVVRCFSTVALVAVVVITLTGFTQGWRQAGSLAAVTGSTYGRLLLAKIGLFAGMVALGAVSRSWLRRRLAGEDGTAPLSRLRQSVAGEALIAVAILAVTAVLVDTVPAKSALAQPFSTELHTDSVLIDVTVDPAKTGAVDVHAYTLTHQGAVLDLPELTAELSLPGRDIGPLEIPLKKAGPGHFVASAFDVPLPGLWELYLVARTSDIHEEDITTEVPIKAG